VLDCGEQVGWGRVPGTAVRGEGPLIHRPAKDPCRRCSALALRGRRHIADPRTRYRSGGGPRSLTQREQVGVLGDALGRPLRFDEIAPETPRRDGHDDAGYDRGMLLNAWPATVGKPATITSTVAEITGVPARSFYDWVVDHAAELN